MIVIMDILDGFPRNIEQAKQYEKLLKELDKELGYVIYLEIDKEDAKKRILGRVSCPNCGSVYNEFYLEAKPKKDGFCDKCNFELTRRSDDNVATFENRFETYINKTKPLIDYYDNKKVLNHIDCGLGKENTFKQIENVIRGNI